ncbi:MAG: hypothetical protein QGH37_05300 [Candidatus Poribacteria bacterium]|jgi:hypothetical protein|nr:hypothetical protein [Candidatus Poribacteria bacterium]
MPIQKPPEQYPEIVNVTPKSINVVTISELLTYRALIWKPTDREQRFLILHYNSQHLYYRNGLSD